MIVAINYIGTHCGLLLHVDTTVPKVVIIEVNDRRENDMEIDKGC